MPKPENIVKHQYKKGESGNLSGRPRKLVSGVIKDLEGKGVDAVTAEQVRHIFMQLVNLSEGELKELLGDHKQPMVNRIVIKAMLSARGWDAIKDMIERAHGRAQQSIDVSGEGINVTFKGVNND